MNNMMKALSASLLMLTATLSAFAIDYIPESEVKTADPFVLYDNGTYYLYGTRAGNPNKGFEAFTSTDLKTWKREGYVITTGHSLYWAPEVYKFDGKYYMYYSANHRLYVATADSPLGPFKDVTGEPMLELGVNTIDNTVFTDTLADGSVQQWMFFVEESGGNTIYRCKLNSDHVTCDASTVQKVLGADQSYEKKVSYKCTEGPIVYKKGNRYFLQYSANTYNSVYYAVCVAFTTSIEGNQWTKLNTNPILNYQKLDNQLYGTGHHGWFIDSDGKLRIVFHAYKNSKCEGTRRVYFGTMKASSRSMSIDLSDPIISPKLYLGGYDHCDSLTTAVQAGTIVTADLNNDGHKDIIAAGNTREVLKCSTLLYDSGTGQWQLHANSLKATGNPAIVPCDFNMDGNIDILAFDTRGENVSDPVSITDADLEREGLFLGDGDGNFSRQELTFIDENGNEANFNMAAPSSADVADFNNDGLPDIVLCGVRPNVQNANVVLINQGNYKFQVRPWDSESELTYASVKAADFNNDGYADFIVSAAKDSGKTPYVAVYQNNPDAPGTFTVRSSGSTGLRNLANGTVQIADINNDGWLDIFLQGSSSNATSTSQFKQYVYINNKRTNIAFKSDSKSSATTTNNNEVARIQNYSNSTAGIIDWDGDGLFDLFVAGRNEGVQTQLGFYYHNVDGHLMKDCIASGASGSAVAFPDWNGDGVRDYLNAGYSTDDLSFNTDFKGTRSTVYYSHETPAPRPSAPLSLAVEGKAGEVSLSWVAASDSQPNTTFEYYVADSGGKLLSQVLSFVGGNDDGVRKVDRLGNAGCNQKLTLALPVGSYTFGVQAINAAYDGSPFATISFSVSADGVSTGIGGIHAGKAAKRLVSRYGVDGVRIGNPVHGVVINRYSDGTVAKQLLRN